MGLAAWCRNRRASTERPERKEHKLRVGDKFSPVDDDRLYEVVAIYTIEGVCEVRRGQHTATFNLAKIEWGLVRDRIIMVEDGPEEDPRWTEAAFKTS